MPWCSLINQTSRDGNTVRGTWLQDHFGSSESAHAAARATERANGGHITVAVVDQLGGCGPVYGEVEAKLIKEPT